MEDIEDSAKTTPIFMIMVGIAAIVSSVGLIKDSPAIIIGAMVIAPLLGPNMALALGTTLGELKMIRRAIRSNGPRCFWLRMARLWPTSFRLPLMPKRKWSRPLRPRGMRLGRFFRRRRRTSKTWESRYEPDDLCGCG